MSIPRSALLYLSLLLACSCRREAPPEAQPIVQSDTSRLSNCPEPKIAKESRPQAPHYRGRCLEGAAWFEPSPEQPNVYTGYKGQGDKVVTLKVSDTGERFTVPGGHDIKLFQVTTLDGQRDFCAGESYEATPEERQQHCPAGEARCDYYEKLKGRALLIPGYWHRGTWQPSQSAHTLACISGVLAKCAYWGYVPGANHQGDPAKPSLTPYFQACVQAARARYTATLDESYTCQGTHIDIYDNLGIQRKRVGAFEFESLWNENGLVCLKRPRYNHCEALKTSACEDPGSAGDTSWNQNQANGLIAVASAPGNDVGACPNTLQECGSRQR